MTWGKERINKTRCRMEILQRVLFDFGYTQTVFLAARTFWNQSLPSTNRETMKETT